MTWPTTSRPPLRTAYEGSGATASSVAATKVATGPDVQKGSFTTPSKPGSYLFQCDVHPEIMTGTLVVR